MAKQLVIVESPAKARTIERYLGGDYHVKSSFGHIRDLPKKGLNIDIEHDFKPTYEISPDKEKVVRELKKAASGATHIWLASDEDREGEAIAWHLTVALNLPAGKTKRIVFHEITKSAIENAIKNPRGVDMGLVDAQQARRLLDRLVGYELSPILWKKVRPGLSAGRVQSVAVRLIVEREREIKEFEPVSDFKVTAELFSGKHSIEAELIEKLKDEKTAKKFLEDVKKASFTVAAVDKKPGTRSPSPPFTTSTLQQAAASRLGFSVKQTMTIAQKLYEEGNITYMRTDSTTLSSLAIKAAEKYIKKEFGDKYYHQHQYQTTSQGAQEAHEAIRPTNITKLKGGRDSGQQKLYQLIWRRAVASQMANADIDRTEVTIDISTRKEKLLAKGEVLLFDGFYKVYGGGKEDSILPPLKNGQKLSLKQMVAAQTFSKPQGRYSEASLVRKLEELGIGRPSTYAPTISTIQDRGYVEKADIEGDQRTIKTFELKSGKITENDVEETFGADRAKLMPTAVAEITTDFLTKHFTDILDYDFTASVEKDFDHIADGKQKWQQMLKDFYKGFHPLIEKGEKVSREETSQTRKLGKDPKSGKPIVARFGRYGPMLQRGSTDEDEKPDFAPLPEGATLENVTLTQALEMFKLPRKVGETKEGEEITANIGRFGPYIQVGKVFVSLKDDDPMKVSEEKARKLYAEKQKQIADKNIAEFPSGIKVLNGPYGPYVTDGKKNASIPDDVKPKKVTEAQAKKILAEAPDKRPRFPRKPSA